MEFGQFKTSLLSTVSSSAARATWWNPVSMVITLKSKMLQNHNRLTFRFRRSMSIREIHASWFVHIPASSTVDHDATWRHGREWEGRGNFGDSRKYLNTQQSRIYLKIKRTMNLKWFGQRSPALCGTWSPQPQFKTCGAWALCCSSHYSIQHQWPLPEVPRRTFEIEIRTNCSDLTVSTKDCCYRHIMV